MNAGPGKWKVFLFVIKQETREEEESAVLSLIVNMA